MHRILFNQGHITITPRPTYCDRGNYLASVWPDSGSELALDLDGSDLWPRYYFDLGRAFDECYAWIEKRGLGVLKTAVKESDDGG